MKYIIFGAGNAASAVLENLKTKKHEVIAFVDNDKNKWGREIKGYRIYPPSKLQKIKKENDQIIISVVNPTMKSEIKLQLMNMGLQPGKDFIENSLSNFGDIPGRVSGKIILPNGFVADKSFDSASILVTMSEKNRIFRMVNKGYEDRYYKVLESCRNYGLLGKYVVYTNIAENQWSLPCSLLLEHSYIAPITYCFEWTPHMYTDYVEFMLNFLMKLADASLGLIDGHHMNATIHNGRFLFIDFGAIGVGITSCEVMYQFLNMHMIPLVLMCRDQEDKAYACLKNSNIVYTLSDVLGYLREEEIKLYKKILSMAFHINNNKDMKEVVDCCKRFIYLLKDYKKQTPWAGYQDNEWERSDNPAKWTLKMKNVVEWIKDIKPNTLLDVAGNMGWYGCYLHETMKYAIIMDMDSECLDSVWERASNGGYRNVVPLYMSFCTPTPPRNYGTAIDSSLSVKPKLKSSKDRCRSDLVLALAIVHHLAFRWQLTFEEIVGQLYEFTNKYLIVEFVDKDDRFIKNFKKERFEWYTIENFERVLSSFFSIEKIRLSQPKETRKLYLCKKI